MSDKNSSDTRGGMGLLGWLFIVLFVLKLNPAGWKENPVADWSWWLVTAPLWGPLAFLAFLGLIWLIVLLLEPKRRKARKARNSLDEYGNSITRKLRR